MSFTSAAYARLVRPVLFHGDAEDAHERLHRSMGVLQQLPGACSLLERVYRVRDGRLVQEWAGLTFSNPIGLAAGFDKRGASLPALESFGFGFLEMGTVTGHPQPGNDRPRLFRLVEDQAILNRMGFNGPGADAVEAHLACIPRLHVPLIINIGLSKKVGTDDFEKIKEDYAYTLRAVYRFGQAITVNVSSPNTPGLRALQGREPLNALLVSVIDQMKRLAARVEEPVKPLFFKIAPDLSDEELKDIIQVYREVADLGVPIGIIATNTTIAREGLKSPKQEEKGGVSGQPLTRRAQTVAELIRRELPDVFLIGVGGIQTPEQAIERLKVANVIQLYTGFVYGGPGLISDLNTAICAELDQRSLKAVSELRGSRL